MDYYLKCWRHYTDFSGRASLSEYWMFFLINLLIGLLLAIPELVMDCDTSILLSIYSLIMFIPHLAVFVRRLHDVGKSGWMFFVSFIPIIGFFWLLILLCKESQEGSNEYGDNPTINVE
ncbi:MAG: DUF805 domain-containing protein [Candidatus Aphodosoma sp.]